MELYEAIEQFSNICYRNDFINAFNNKRYPKKIVFLGLDKDYSKKYNCQMYSFRINDREQNYVKIGLDAKNKVVVRGCTCRNHRLYESCEHVAGVILYFYPALKNLDNFNMTDYSNAFLDRYNDSATSKIKKEVRVEVNITKNDSNYYYYSREYLDIKITIGLDKLYNLNNKFSRFWEIYESQDDSFSFGKNFTYDPTCHYFSEDSQKIIEAYNNYLETLNYNRRKAAKNFLKALKNIPFVFNNYKIPRIMEGFPIRTTLSKENEKYILQFIKENSDLVIEDDYEYVLYEGKLYHLNIKEQNLLKDIWEEDIEKLEITKEQFNKFTKGLFLYLKNNLEVDGSVDDVILPKNITTELYFDIAYNKIIANPKFRYDNEEVSYFAKNSLVLRDMDYETEVINDVLHYGFIIENETLELKDLDQQVVFLEEGLETLAEKYVIYTSEKLKNTQIKKKSNITSMFGIGKDNILSYSFDLGDINSDELVNIFKNIKNKKKYYRLKNGNILSLEDESLQELEQLTEDLELSDEDIINGKGEVLKYRAIYLDSLKKNKYNIISTDNLFDDFIKNFYAYKDSELTLSNDELKILRDYQVTGVKWLYNLQKTGFGGILADEMGLGKTIQVIYYLKQILKEEADAAFLIVVPTSLAYNWDHEFDLYGPNIKKIICVGPKAKREAILNDYQNGVIVTTYGLLREDEELYQNKHFHTMIIDEAQNIKNYQAGVSKCVKKIKANTKFALTGTPLENSILELWSIFDFIMPGYLATLTRFQTKYRIKDFNEDSERLIAGLNKQINPFILRRKKSDVTKELPEKLLNDIFIELGDEQKKLYVAELERVQKEAEEIMQNGGKNEIQFKILTLLTRLRQICIDPSIIYEDYQNGSNKIDTLIHIIKEYIANNHKILIFSSFRTALNIVKTQLNEAKIASFMIDGTVKSQNRMAMVNEFNESDKAKVFLIMLKSGGTGLNLTAADVVIHLDLWWNPQAENQATDRAHRIGQTKVVEVIHLIMKGTIEEKILELQNKKRLLSDKIIDGSVRTKNLINELTEEDIKNLLAYENKD